MPSNYYKNVKQCIKCLEILTIVLLFIIIKTDSKKAKYKRGYKNEDDDKGQQ